MPERYKYFLLARFRCCVGCALTFETVLDEQAGTIEDALYTALNALQENTAVGLAINRLSGVPMPLWR